MPQFFEYLKNLKNKPLIIIIIVALTLPIIIALSGTANLSSFLARFRNITSTPTKYLCPSEKVFCESGSDIVSNGQYIGFGADLASGSAVLASFDGKLTPTKTTIPSGSTKENLVVLYLDSKDSGKRAVYIFKGDSSIEREVHMSEAIGKVREKMNFFNTSLIFQVLPDINSSSIIKITPKDFVY
mgnify:CR=1 FL=1